MSNTVVAARDSAGCIRLSGVDWNLYSRFLRDFENQRGIRLTYDRGELEMMSHSSSSPGCIRLCCVDWKTYTRLLRDFAEFPGIRLTYDDGELEIMSPLLKHDDDSRFLGVLVFVLTEELNLPLKHGGSTTMRRPLVKKGLEADECFWIANAHRMKGRRRLDLRVDPPPDLAIEVDVTRSSLNRLGIYAQLRVPEVWRLKGKQLTFLILGDDGEYASAAASLSFPLVTPADLLGFIRKARKAKDENAVVRGFRKWIRQRLAKQP